MTRALVAAALAGCFAAPSLSVAQVANGSTRDRLLVTPAWLVEHIDDSDLVVLQVGRKETYDNGHIPGARLVDFDAGALSAGHERTDPLTLEMLPADALRQQLEALGISDRSRVVVVAADNYWSPSTRIVLTLDYAGLANVTWLDGGLKGWTDAGRPLSKDMPVVKAGSLSSLKLRPVIVDADFVRAHEHAPGFAIVDARARTFYDGIPMTMRGDGPPQKLGHIPGAVSAPFDLFAMGMGQGTQLKPADQLEAMFTAAGVKPGDTIIGYCHVGQQATAMLFAARTLGHDVLLYDGSFQDWQKRDLPVENPSAKKDR